MTQIPVLKTVSLVKKFDQTLAVNNVSIEIFSGEVHALIGENGSGKSTVVSMISGVYSKTEGKILLENQEINPKNLLEANKMGISMVVQEMNTIEDLSVAENIFFGCEDQFSAKTVINKKKMNAKANELLKEYGFNNIKAENDISEYTFEQRKMIEVLRATYFTPKVLIIDETTTALSYEGRQKLFEILNQVKEKGTAIIIISHDLSEILELCDRITVLRDGQFIISKENQGLTEDDLKSWMIGREFSSEYYRSDNNCNCTGEVVLEAKNISALNLLKNINIQLHRGEILGIGGLTESGIQKIGKVLFGAEKPDQGEVINHITQNKVTSIGKSIADGVAYTSKNRDQEGLILSASIRDNIAIINYDLFSKGPFISNKGERLTAQSFSEKMKVKMTSINQTVRSLSGGNKQKVVLAKWVAHDSEILILDSPTRGIDVGVKSAIYKLMGEMVASGKSIIMISEEIMELIGMCDRILVLNNGEISGTLRRDESITEEKIIQYML